MMNKIRHRETINDFQDITSLVYDLIPEEELLKICPNIECDRSFIGFVYAYYYLSKIIPKDHTIIDLGCGYNAQSYLFQDHECYIAIDIEGEADKTVFVAPSTEYYKVSIDNFIDKLYSYGIDNTTKVFAICNYVPINNDTLQRIKATFQNVYTFYP